MRGVKLTQLCWPSDQIDQDFDQLERVVLVLAQWTWVVVVELVLELDGEELQQDELGL